MNDPTIVVAILGVAGTGIAGWLALKGATRTASASKEAAAQATQATAQDSALKAWESLLEPYRQEVSQLRERLEASDRKHEAQREVTEQQIAKMTERIDFLTLQLEHWKRLAKVIARWATNLRDQVLSLGGTVPATPDELLLIQSLDDDVTL